MFLNHLQKKNPKLIEASFQLHQSGKILPDTYVVDMDTFRENARKMLEEANKVHIDLYFMLKQLGRNPYIAKALVKLGFTGAVVVDFKEAQVMMDHQIPIANVGHLVQMPKAMVKNLVAYGCKYMTVFSVEKAKEISDEATLQGKTQKILLKVVGKKDMIYSGQTAGFHLENLNHVIQELKQLSGIEIAGVTSFPCFLYEEAKDCIAPTANLSTLLSAKQLLEAQGIEIENINAPSATCSFTLQAMKDYPINSAEPGHGLSGTTPMHASKDCVEIPCVTYVSEVSHNFNEKAYCYGGGHYRRSHVAHALVGTTQHYEQLHVTPPNLESIDYYFELAHPCTVSDTVLMAFRFQMFVTRSSIAIVEGIQSGNPTIIGVYHTQGGLLHE